MHGYMLKLGNPFLTQWQRRYFYLFPNRVEWRGEGESRVSSPHSTDIQSLFMFMSVCPKEKGVCLFVCPDSTLKEKWLKHFKKQKEGVSVNTRSRSLSCLLHPCPCLCLQGV